MKKSTLSLLLLIGISSFLLAGNFSRDNIKEVVTDNVTGLIWQDDVAAKTVTKTWEDAIDYCEALTLGGYTDWHLPNYNELYSIGDRSRYNPSIDSTFQNVVSDYYWSSTTIARDISSAWGVYFDTGYDFMSGKTNTYYVRCVRDN